MVSSATQLRTALLLVDIQNAFNHPTFWGSSRSNPGFDEHVTKLLAAFREHEKEVSIIHVYHSSVGEGSVLNPKTGDGHGAKFMDFATPSEGEPVISKRVNSCFIGTDLEKMLREAGIQQLVICGLTTDHCVSTTTRMAANLGWKNGAGAYGHVDGGNVIIVKDACATFNRGKFDAETMHEVALASLDDEFADVLTTAEVLRHLF